MATSLPGPLPGAHPIREGSGQGRRIAEKRPACQRSGGTGEYPDNREVVCDLGKLWPFGMEGEEVALERGQERAEPVEMRAGRHENARRRKDVCRGAGVDKEMNKATPEELVLPTCSLVLRNSSEPLSQREYSCGGLAMSAEDTGDQPGRS